MFLITWKSPASELHSRSFPRAWGAARAGSSLCVAPAGTLLLATSPGHPPGDQTAVSLLHPRRLAAAPLPGAHILQLLLCSLSKADSFSTGRAGAGLEFPGTPPSLTGDTTNPGITPCGPLGRATAPQGTLTPSSLGLEGWSCPRTKSRACKSRLLSILIPLCLEVEQRAEEPLGPPGLLVPALGVCAIGTSVCWLGGCSMACRSSYQQESVRI